MVVTKEESKVREMPRAVAMPEDLASDMRVIIDYLSGSKPLTLEEKGDVCDVDS